MKHKTWFRLVLKAIGILLIAMSLPSFGQVIGFVTYSILDTGTIGRYPDNYWIVQVSYYGGGLLQFAFGLYLILGGRWIVDRAIPSNRPYCPECGYDMSRSQSARCPECGVELPRDSAGSISHHVQAGVR